MSSRRMEVMMDVYEEGAKVQFTVDGNLSKLRTGKIRGIAYKQVITHWIIAPDERIEGWEYSTVCIQDSFIRRIGENRLFGCETALAVSRHPHSTEYEGFKPDGD